MFITQNNQSRFVQIAYQDYVTFYLMAIASISINTSFGNLATSTHDLVGHSDEKYFEYTSLIFPKSSIFLIKTVVFTTFAAFVPAASSKFTKFPI